jgi:PHP family Zn ribbon phosphoesterase
MSGLHFKKLDLHVHTPASKCYIDKSHTAQQIVRSAIDNGFDGIAITDHNTAEWIDQIKDATKESGLVVFPGVELSLEHGHLVALFDPKCTQKDIEGLLGTLDIKPAEFGQPETICTKNVYDVVEKIHERGGLAILAHIDDFKGIFHDNADFKEGGKVSVPASLRKILNEAQYDAVECTGEQLPDGFDAAHQIKRFPAFYQASDNPDIKEPKKHSFTGIGHRYSWFKLDQMDIEGLRQCFADPEVRIQIMGQHQDLGYPKIKGMKIGSAGFLGNQVFEFHQGLNSLIGGKGVGKSLAIEMLRFCLQQPSRDENLKSDHLGKLDKRLEAGNWVEVEYQLTDGTS